jgi:hypothetical protein
MVLLKNRFLGSLSHYELPIVEQSVIVGMDEKMFFGFVIFV